MSFSDIIEQSDTFCENISKECDNAKDKYIKKFQDVKTVIATVNDIIDIRRSLQRVIIKLDNVNAFLRNNLNEKELTYTKALDDQEEEWNGTNGKKVKVRSSKEIDLKQSTMSSPFLTNIQKINQESSPDDEQSKNNSGFTIVNSKRRPVSKERNPTHVQSKYIMVDLGFDHPIQLQIYEKKEDIPELTYGIVKNSSSSVCHKYIIIFKISKNSYTSCEMGSIAPEDNNIRTVICNSIPYCKYGNSCNYYHSPLYYPDTDHIRFFFKTPLCPKDPTFGDGSTFQHQKLALKFIDVSTLASYCATQLLLIRLLCKHNDM